MRARLLKTTLALLTGCLTPFFPLVATASQPVLPSGTHLTVELTVTLSTRANQVGDPFTASFEDPIFAGGEEVIPAGSTLYGHVSYVKSPKRAKGLAEMRLVADSILTPNGKKYNLSAGLGNDNGDNGPKVNGEEGTIEGAGKSGKQTAKESGIGAAAGAGVGAIADGGTGALYGAAIGALAGVIHIIAKKHKDVVLHPGTELTFILSRPAALAAGTSPSPPNQHP